MTITMNNTKHETPTLNHDLPKIYGDFDSLAAALDYAAKGQTGVNFFSPRTGLDQAYSYGDIRDIAMKQARQLLSLGLKREARIGIIADMNIDFITLFMACQYAGLLAVPLPVVTGLGGRQEYESQLTRVLKSSESVIALGPQSSQKSLQAAAQDLNMVLIGTVDDLDTKAIQAISEDDMSEDDINTIELCPFGKDDPSHIQFSSGSTRNPLGVLISQKSMMANAQSVAKDGLQFREDDRVASWLPFYHDMGLIGFLLIPMTSQLSIDYMHTDDFARRPIGWLSMITLTKSTITFSPTFGYDICTRRAARKSDLELDLSSIRIAGIGGEMVQPEVLDQFANSFADYGFNANAFSPSYGMAEATLAFSFSPIGTGVDIDAIDRQSLIEDGIAVSPSMLDRKNKPSSLENEIRVFAKCGSPMPGYDVEIRDEDGQILGERHVGTIFIKGPSLMTCYDKNPQATAEVMVENDWLNTGDMGYMVDGKLVITGRCKDLIIVNGRNIWPQDLEWHAEENIDHLRSRTTAAFSIDGQDGKEEAVILVQCRTSDPETQKDIKQQVKAVIFRNAGIDCHVELIPMGSLPFTTSGKLSRSKAKKDYLKGAYTIMDVANIANNANNANNDAPSQTGSAASASTSPADIKRMSIQAPKKAKKLAHQNA